MTAKKCTKKCDAHSKLLFCQSKPISFLLFELTSPLLLLKLPSKNHTRKKRSGKSIVPRLELKLPDRKESFSEISARITRDVNLREKLIDKNESLADKIESNPESEFTESRKDELRKNQKVIKDLNGDIKKHIGKLTNDEKKRLPEDIQNLRRFI